MENTRRDPRTHVRRKRQHSNIEMRYQQEEREDKETRSEDVEAIASVKPNTIRNKIEDA